MKENIGPHWGTDLGTWRLPRGKTVRRAGLSLSARKGRSKGSLTLFNILLDLLYKKLKWVEISDLCRAVVQTGNPRKRAGEPWSSADPQGPRKLL